MASEETATTRKSEDQNSTITADCPATYGDTSNKSTPSPDDDQQYAVETLRHTSLVTKIITQAISMYFVIKAINPL